MTAKIEQWMENVAKVREILLHLRSLTDGTIGYFRHQNHITGNGDYDNLGRVTTEVLVQLETSCEAIIAARAPTIEEWFERGRRAAFQANNKSGCACGIDENDNVLEVCAVHAAWCKSYAPKQEPSVPVSELKAWRNTASIPLTYSDAVAFDDLIRQAEAAGV